MMPFLVPVLRSAPDHIPLNKGVQIIDVFDLGMSTLTIRSQLIRVWYLLFEYACNQGP